MNYYPNKCDTCGKFLPSKGYISYTEYSGASEFEPREPANLCKPCYDKADKELINRIAWIKPHEVKEHKGYG